MPKHVNERRVLVTCLGIGVSVCDSPVVAAVVVVKVTQPLLKHCWERDQTHEPQKGKMSCRWGMLNGESEQRRQRESWSCMLQLLQLLKVAARDRSMAKQQAVSVCA